MAETIKTYPYEILVRLSYAPGEIAGAIRGISLAQLSFIVDDAGVIVGRVDRGSADNPMPFPQDKLVAVIGDAIIATTKAHQVELEAITVEHNNDIAALQEQLDAAKAEIEALKSQQ